jgi:hypothetical protein
VIVDWHGSKEAGSRKVVDCYIISRVYSCCLMEPGIYILQIQNKSIFCRLTPVGLGNSLATPLGLAISDKNYSAEDVIDGKIGLFRRNSGCSAEQKIFGIPFRTIPCKRKMFGFLFRGTKIEANSRNSDPNHFAKEKKGQNSIPCMKNRSKLWEIRSETFRGRETTRNSVPWKKNRRKLSEFRSDPKLF